MYSIILGAGEVGRYLARVLYEEGHDLTMVDEDPYALERLEDSYDLHKIEGNGASPNVLRWAEIERAELFLAVTDNDEVNLLAAAAAKQLGCKQCVARVQKSIYIEDAQAFYRDALDIDLVISPQMLSASEVVKMIRTPGCESVEEFVRGRVQMKQLVLPENSPLANKPLKDLKLPSGTLLAAIFRGEDTIIPRGDDKLQVGDEVFVLGERKSMKRVEEAFGKSERRPRKIIIAGGGEIGMAIAQRLQFLGMELKLIEQNEERCRELAKELPRVLILHGDGTDTNLLKEERIEAADYFIAVSGEDEINLMSGLLAKAQGVKKTIVLVNKPDYQGVYSRLGIDTVISPRLLTAKKILHFIKTDEVISIEVIGDNRAEILEMRASEKSSIIGKPLKDIEFPPGAIIGAVVRGDDVIIPNGQSCIQATDTLVVFSLPEARLKAEQILLGRRRR